MSFPLVHSARARGGPAVGSYRTPQPFVEWSLAATYAQNGVV